MAAPVISQQIPNTFLATTGTYSTDYRDLNRHFTGATSFSLRSAGALGATGLTQTAFTVVGQGSGNSIVLTLPILANWNGTDIIGGAAATARLAMVLNAPATEVGLSADVVELRFQATTVTLQDIKTLWEGTGFGGSAVITGSTTASVTAFAATGSVRTTNGSGDGSLTGGVVGLVGTAEQRTGSNAITVTVRATNADGHTDMNFDVRVVQAVRTGTVAAGARPDSSLWNPGDWLFDGNEAWWKKDSGIWDATTTLGEDSGVRIRFLESGTNRTSDYVLFDSGTIPTALVKTVLQNGNAVVAPVTMRVGFGFNDYGSNDIDWGAAEHAGGVQIRVKDSSGSYRASQVDFTDDWEANFQYIARKTVQNTNELYIGRLTGADVLGAVVDEETVYAYSFPSTNLDWFTGTGGANHATELLQVAFVDSRVRGTGAGVSSGWIPTSVEEGSAIKWAAYSTLTLATPSAPTASPQTGGFLVSAPSLSPGASYWRVRHRIGTASWTESGNLSGANESLTGLTPGQEYQIQVRQIPPSVGSSYLASAWSLSTTATVPTVVLSTPTAPVVASGDKGLTITRPGSPPTGTSNWQIIYSTNGSPPVVTNVTVASDTTSHMISALDPAIEYSVTVKWLATPGSGYSDSLASPATTAYPYGVGIGATNPSSLSEENLNTATIRLDLHTNTPVFNASLSVSDFQLSSAPPGATISSVSRSTLNSRQATATIAYNPTTGDFDTALLMSIRVLAAAYGGSVNLLSNTVNVAATVEVTPSFSTAMLPAISMVFGNTETAVFGNAGGLPAASYAITNPVSLGTGVAFHAGTRTLSIGATAPAQNQRFICTATNRAGSDDQYVDVSITRKQLTAPTIFTVGAGEQRIRISNVALPANSTGWYYRYAASEALLASATISAKQQVSTTSVDITGLTAGTTYYIQIQAEGIGNYSNSQWSVSQNIAPVAISGAYATLSSSPVTLTEDNLNDAVLTISLAPNATFAAFSGNFADYFTLSGLPSGVVLGSTTATAVSGSTSVTFTLSKAADVDIDIPGIISVVVKGVAYNEGSIDLPATSTTYTATVEFPPGVVPNFAAASRNAAIELSWDAAAGATGYEYERKRSSDSNWDSPISLSLSASPHTVTGLTNGTAYDFRIRAVKIKANAGSWSSTVTATPMSPSLSATTTPSALTEGNLENALVSLTLMNAEFEAASEITDADFSITGITGVSIKSGSVSRSSITAASLRLAYDGTDFDVPENLVVTARASAILNDNSPVSATISVGRLLESATLALSASTEAALGATFTLTVTLANEEFNTGLSTSNFSVSGLPTGAVLSSVTRTSATVAALNMTYNGRDFDSDATIAVTCRASGLSRNGDIVSNTQTITARTETATLASSAALTEDNLESVNLTTTLLGEEYNASIQISDFSLSFFDQDGNATTLANGVSVASATRTSATVATLTLSTPSQFDLDVPVSLRVVAAASGHSGEDSLTTNALSISETVEPALVIAGINAVSHAGRVVVSWTDPSDSDIQKYQRRHRQSDGPAFQDSHWTDINGSDSSTTTYEFSGLTDEVEYVFEIRAIKGYRFPPGRAASITAYSGASTAEITGLVPETPTEENLLTSIEVSLERRAFVATPTTGDFRVVNWGGDFGVRYNGIVSMGSGPRNGLLVVAQQQRLPPYWFSADAEWDRLVALVGVGPTGQFRFETGIIGHTAGPELTDNMESSIAVMMKSGTHSFLVTSFSFDANAMEPYEGTPANSTEITAFHNAISVGDSVEITIWDTRALNIQSVNRASDTEVALGIMVMPATLEVQDFDRTIEFSVDVLPGAHDGSELLLTGKREILARADTEYAAYSLVNRTHLDEENLPGAMVNISLHRAEFDSTIVGTSVTRNIILGNTATPLSEHYIEVNLSITTSTTATFTIPATYTVPSFAMRDTTLTVPFAASDVNGKEIPEVVIPVTATRPILASPASSFSEYSMATPLGMEKGETRTWILSYHFIDPGQPDDSRLVYSVSPSAVGGLSASVSGDRLTLTAGNSISSSLAVFTITASRSLGMVTATITLYAEVSDIPLEFRPTTNFPFDGINAVVDGSHPLVRLDESFQHPANTVFNADVIGPRHRAVSIDIGTGFDLMARHNPCVTRFSRIPPIGNAMGHPILNAWSKDGEYKVTGGVIFLTGRPENLRSVLAANETPDANWGSLADLYINQNDLRAFLRGRGILSPLAGVDGDFISPVSGILWREEDIESTITSVTASNTATIASSHNIPSAYTFGGAQMMVTGFSLGTSSTFSMNGRFSDNVKNNMRLIFRSMGSSSGKLQHNILALDMTAASVGSPGYVLQATNLTASQAFLLTQIQDNPFSERIIANTETGSTALTTFLANTNALTDYVFGTITHDANDIDFAVVDAIVRCNGGSSQQTLVDVLNPWVPIDLRLLTEDDVQVKSNGCPEANKGSVTDILVARNGVTFIKGLEPFTSALGADTGVRFRRTIASFSRPGGNLHYQLQAPLPLPGDLFRDRSEHGLLTMNLNSNGVILLEFEAGGLLTGSAAKNIRFVLRKGSSPFAIDDYYVFGIKADNYHNLGISIQFSVDDPEELAQWLSGLTGETATLALVDVARRCEPEIATNPWIVYDTLTTEDTEGVREFVFANGSANELPPSDWIFDNPQDGGVTHTGVTYYDNMQEAIKGEPLVGGENGVNIRGTYVLVTPDPSEFETIANTQIRVDAVAGESKEYVYIKAIAINNSVKPPWSIREFFPKHVLEN